MQSKLLIVCGPTSTGKTNLALLLAKKFNGEIVSADSRQVYKGMDIGTGKDLPTGAKLKTPWFWKFGYYETDGVKIWGYDLIDPRKEFSVAQYLTFAEKVIPNIIKRKKLPIVVGGTGLYIKAVVDGIPTAQVPRNDRFRRALSQKSVAELFEMLAQLDSLRAGGMNASDRKNPRRLIRAIEIAVSSEKPTKLQNTKYQILDTLLIGLTAPSATLFDRIKVRVSERVKKGVEKEIQILLKRGMMWKSQAMTSLGYNQWQEYFSGKKSRRETVREWGEEERKYTKRQMTWFKKDKRIIWFDVTEKNLAKNVEKRVEKWYISKDA